MADVARSVGVHPSTVSRVLSGDTSLSIRPDTRDRILLAVQKQGYRPNALARALKQSRTGALAMVVPLLRNPIWSSIQRGALHAAAECDQVVMFLDEPEDSARTPIEYQHLIEESRADGLLIATSERLPRGRQRELTVPHVYLNRRGPGEGNNVVMDEEGAMQLFVDHLAALGHRRIAVIDGHKNIDTPFRRAAAVRSLCHERGMSATFEHDADTEIGGYEATLHLLARREHPTAIGVGNLGQLFGVLKALREAGAVVPRDVSLVSFDEDACLEFLEAPITSVSMPLVELGAAAVRALVDRIDGRPGHDVLVRDPLVLVDRSSTAPPRGGRRIGA
ncbi:LacI family DNA-binding transcriptional regulator [Nocardioides mesophilus]|uniref:LacI family DNA-binding transcriptional regulator n=1 Tax=Nocardioides mesophilus TaxID=433659 RepID=A0A7G9RCC3_9ACTN|nr:LacI family DNA-binding transcriptional regulator [Nocardioides mesophilus]QNN53248.1 LacI family DNA-binding transcriptional regulator [Nocardioides mesophilus]